MTNLNTQPYSPWSPEGRVRASAFESQGIVVCKADDFTHSVLPYLEHGYCRYRILIPRRDHKAAIEIAKAAAQNEFEPSYPCPNCCGNTRQIRRLGLMTLMFLFTGWVLPFFNKLRRCGSCKLTWTPPPNPSFTKEELGYENAPHSFSFMNWIFNIPNQIRNIGTD
jgi:hypothetical protein